MKSNLLNQTDQPVAGTQTSFAHACLVSCQKLLAQLGNVKGQILAEFRERLGGHKHLLDLAVNEAEALAWETGFPQLLFPTLATEKAQGVATWHARQQFLSAQNAPLSVAA